MRLAQIKLEPYAADSHQTIQGVVVWQPHGWFAHIVLNDVTGPEFGKLVDLINSTSAVRFMAIKNQTYDGLRRTAYIAIHDPEYFADSVRRGVLSNPQAMLELGLTLFERLQDQLKQNRNRQS